MRLDHAFNKFGIQIVQQTSPSPTSATLVIRVPATAMRMWGSAVEEILVASEKGARDSDEALRWSVDVSRVYFLDKSTKQVRYLWRLVLSGNCAAGAETIGLTLVRLLSANFELTSQPLVGRVDYGGTKGAHGPGEAERLIAKGFQVGGSS